MPWAAQIFLEVTPTHHGSHGTGIYLPIHLLDFSYLGQCVNFKTITHSANGLGTGGLGGWWFGILRVPLSDKFFLKGIPGIQTTWPQTISWHIHLPPKKNILLNFRGYPFEKGTKQFFFSGGQLRVGWWNHLCNLFQSVFFWPPFPGVAWIFFPSKSVLWKWDFLYFLMQLISSQNGLGDTNNTVVGRNPAEYGKYPHYLPRFYTSQVVVWDFCSSTVVPKKPHFRNQQIQSSHLSDSANFGLSRWWIE